MTTHMPSIGEKVRALRKSREMSQRDFALTVKIKVDKISAVESGRSEYNPKQLDKIKDFFDKKSSNLEIRNYQ